eukprot:3357669-Amphidinium_carterae.2
MKGFEAHHIYGAHDVEAADIAEHFRLTGERVQKPQTTNLAEHRSLMGFASVTSVSESNLLETPTSVRTKRMRNDKTKQQHKTLILLHAFALL